jgi:hypothetical protein
MERYITRYEMFQKKIILRAKATYKNAYISQLSETFKS